MKNWIQLSLCGLILTSAGCVCSTGGNSGCFEFGPVAYRQTTCGPCDSGCSCNSNGDFYAGPRPLAKFIGLTSCNGGGCGELYVDEWLNEPPQVDQCGYNECLQCGHSPLRTLLNAISGRRYIGHCDGCDGSSALVGNGAIVQDGYEPGTWSSQRSCACGSSKVNTYSTENVAEQISNPIVDPSKVGGPTDSQGQSILNSTPTAPRPPIEKADSQSKTVAPTPAPALPPSSASRLNPAIRRVMR